MVASRIHAHALEAKASERKSPRPSCAGVGLGFRGGASAADALLMRKAEIAIGRLSA